MAGSTLHPRYAFHSEFRVRLSFLAGPQARRESTAGLVRESYLKRKRIPVKRASWRTVISRHNEARQDTNLLDALILACEIIRRSRWPECHHPKCARPKEFWVAVRVVNLTVYRSPSKRALPELRFFSDYRIGIFVREQNPYHVFVDCNP